MQAKDFIRFADITYRQLDYWCSQGWIEPVAIAEDKFFSRGEHSPEKLRNPGSGRDRLFTHAMAERAKMIKCLTRAGIEMTTAVKLAKAHEEGSKSMYLGHGVTVLIEPHSH